VIDSPSPERAVPPQGQGVAPVIPSPRRHRCPIGVASNLDRTALAVSRPVPQLAEAVVSPSPEPAVLPQAQSMIGPRRHGRPVGIGPNGHDLARATPIC